MVLFRDTRKKLLSLITFYFIILRNSFIHSMNKPLLSDLYVLGWALCELLREKMQNL